MNERTDYVGPVTAWLEGNPFLAGAWLEGGRLLSGPLSPLFYDRFHLPDQLPESSSYAAIRQKSGFAVTRLFPRNFPPSISSLSLPRGGYVSSGGWDEYRGLISLFEFSFFHRFLLLLLLSGWKNDFFWEKGNARLRRFVCIRTR